MNTIAKCDQCEIEINTEDDMFYHSERTGETMCVSCHDSDLMYGSTILFAGPEYPNDGDGPFRITVGDAFIEDRWGEGWNDLEINRIYISTDGWRGYQQTTIEGWSEILGGWTTGDHGDSISVPKQIFNQWAESLFDAEIVPPVNVAIVTDPTSNVFSTAISVLVADDDVETFTGWLNGELETLRYALT